MSAIYGAVGIQDSVRLAEIKESWTNHYKQFQIDRMEQITKESAFFGCGIQYFTEEAKKEVLPIWDEERQLLFTADCVIDNREELFQLLDIESAGNNQIPDGQLLYQTYLKYGNDCHKYLRGVYTFAAYDMRKGEVTLAVDHFAQRCLFYHVRGNEVYFSTLFFPIAQKLDLPFKANMRWLIDCQAMLGPCMMNEARETALDQVYKVESGTYVTVRLKEKTLFKKASRQNTDDFSSVEITRYFDPDKTYPTNPSITMKQSEEMVKATLTKAIKPMLRTCGQVGSQLSCGLDSSSVACVAAGFLNEKKQKLYTFTSVPLKEAELKNKGGIIYDEAPGVKEICKAYPNMEPTFVECRNRTYLEEVDQMVAIWEEPCKSQQNAVWIDEIYKEAREKNVRILLTGATGNCTISAGSIENSVYDHLKHFRWRKAYHTFDAIKKIGVSRKRYAKVLIDMAKEYYSWYLHKEKRNYYLTNLVRQDVGEEHDLLKRYAKDIYHIFPFFDLKGMRTQMYMTNANAQIGEIDTKYSLKYGVLQRDPMRTVDMMELCFSLPIECFCANDYDRRLVREGMAGIVPESIRHDVLHRGKQSGDYNYRLKQIWEQKLPEIRKELKDEKTLEILDQVKIEAELEKEEPNIQTLIDSYTFSRFLKQLKIQ